MVKGVNNFSLKGSVRFAFLFSFVSFFILKSASALVYLGQSYSGWGIGGYGWNDVASLYATSGGWFDFAFLFALFYSAALGVFGEKFKENNAGKGIAVALGLILALSLVLYESYMGITLWELAAPLVVLLALLGTFALVHGSFKKMGFKGWTPPLAAIIATVMMWYAIMSSTGMGQRTFMDFTLGSFDLSEPLLWMLGPVFIFLLIKSLFGVAKHFKGGSSTPSGPRRKFRWPFGRNKQPKTPTTSETLEEDTSSAIALPATDPNWKNKQVDPDRLRRLNKLVGRIDYINKDALNLTNQLISYTYYLNEDLKKKEQQVNLNAWGIGTKLHKILKDLGYFKRTLTADHTTLEGLASLANYFRSILLDLNKVVANVEKINQNPYKNYIKNIHRSTAGVWNNLSELNTVVKKIFSASGEYLGKGVKNLTLAQFKKVISNWSGTPHEEPPESRLEVNPVEEQREQRALPAPKEEPSETQNPESEKIYGEIMAKTSPEQIRSYPVIIQQRINNIKVYAIGAYKENNHPGLLKLQKQLTALIEGSRRNNEEAIKWSENAIRSMEGLYAFLQRMNVAFGNVKNYTRHPKNIKNLESTGMENAITLRDRMLAFSSMLGNGEKDPLTPQGTYRYLQEVAKQLSGSQLKDETKKDIFRGVLTVSREIGHRLDLMQKEDILFNEVNFAYGLAEPKKIALDGKSFEQFIRAAMKYNVALYNYANKINNSM